MDGPAMPSQRPSSRILVRCACWWFLRELRASRPPSANAPVFTISGERHERRDPASGFAGCLLKPVDLDVLASTLSRVPRAAL
jgi:hypothetical protein